LLHLLTRRNSKTAANLKAIPERQSLNKLSQDQKTKTDALLSATDKLEVVERKLTHLSTDEANLRTRKSDVSVLSHRLAIHY